MSWTDYSGVYNTPELWFLLQVKRTVVILAYSTEFMWKLWPLCWIRISVILSRHISDYPVVSLKKIILSFLYFKCKSETSKKDCVCYDKNEKKLNTSQEYIRWVFASSKCLLASNKPSTKEMCNEFAGKVPISMGMFEVLLWNNKLRYKNESLMYWKNVLGSLAKLNVLGKGKLHLISYDMPTLAIIKNLSVWY